MHGHSGSIGSFTLTSISALAHTSAAFGTSVPPAARYASSGNPDPSPAPCSTSTVCPSPTSDSTPAGTSATRFSAVLISLGTPTIMRSPFDVPRCTSHDSRETPSVLRLRVTSLRDAFVLRLLAFRPQPNHRQAFRIEEFGGVRRHLVFGEPGHSRQHLVEALIRLAVDREARQTIHPGGRTLQGEHQLSLRLLLRLGERVAAQPLARQLGVLLADRRDGLRLRLRLRADIHPRHPHLVIEARERVDRVGQAELFAD